MKKPRLKILTLLIGIIVALTAVSFGIGMAKSNKMANVKPESELPSVHLMDLNKVIYLFFAK